MKLQVQFVKLGMRFTFEASSDKEIIERLSFWMSLPDACPVCNSSLSLAYRKAQGKHDYYELVCQEGHKNQLGQNVNGDTLYYTEDKRWQELAEDGEWVVIPRRRFQNQSPVVGRA